MIIKKNRFSRIYVSIVGIIALAMLLVTQVSAVQSFTDYLGMNQTAEQDLESAWAMLNKLDGYEFRTQVKQQTAPAPVRSNAGRAARIDQLMLEGALNRANEGLNVWLWEGFYERYEREEALEIKIEGDRAYGRYGAGNWEEIDNIGSLIAPGMDVGAFLVGAQHVTRLEDEVREIPNSAAGSGAVSFAVYSFVLDGEKVADYANESINRSLRRRGELPQGLTIEAGSVFEDAIGRGTVWVDENLVPARMTIDLEFPQEANGERVSATIQTDIFELAIPPQVSAMARIQQMPQNVAAALLAVEWELVGLALGTVLAFVGLCVFVMRSRKKMFIYRIVSGTLALGMFVSPFASMAQAYHYEEQLDYFVNSRGIERPTLHAPESDTAEFLNEEQTVFGQLPSFDMTTDPLASGEAEWVARQTVLSPAAVAQQGLDPNDSDGDGLSDAEESTWGTSPVFPDTDGDGLSDGQEAALCQDPNSSNCALPTRSDTDFDGLTDGQEILFLATQPNNKDSDLDGIHDNIEVLAFGDGLYTDAINPDSDFDGILDGQECPERLDGNAGNCANTDGDGLPDVLDDDSDNDGFFDTVDSAPTGSMGTLSDPLFGTNHFNLIVDGLEADREVFVDFQIRTAGDDGNARLSYPTSVLDWPSGDTEGQVQRRLDTTFAEVWNSSDPALANGDMRVVPMLELEMDPANAPLPRTAARFSTPVIASVPLGVVKLFDNEDQNRVDVRLSSIDKRQGEQLDLLISKGSCEAALVEWTYSDVDEQQTYSLNDTRLTDVANGEYVIVLGNSAENVCQPIEKAVAGSSVLSYALRRDPMNFGDMRFNQVGADIEVIFDVTNEAANDGYNVQVVAGSCDARGAEQFNLLSLTQGSPKATVSNRNLTDIANANHALIVSTAGSGGVEQFCRTMPNLVNGGDAYTNMIDVERLTQQFNVSVHEKDESGRLVAYVPATTIVDTQSGRTAGFGGRMPFVTDSGNQAIRADTKLVWHVQVLTDFCSDPPADYMTTADEQTRMANWCGTSGNQLQVVHQYDDPAWILAGLTVREDHSQQVAALYENPEEDNNLEADDYLWHAAEALSSTFITGRKDGGQRDVTIADLETHLSSWGLSSEVAVETFEEKSSHNGFGDIVQTDLPELLDESFLDMSGSPIAKMPLVLFAGEETFRAVELDGDAYNTENGTQLVVNLNGGPGLEPVVVSTLHWKPYTYAENKWEAVPLEQYWTEIESRMFESEGFSAGDLSGEYVLAAETRIAQIYFTSLYMGENRTVQVGDTVIQGSIEGSASDAAIAQRMADAKAGALDIKKGGMVKSVIQPVIAALTSDYIVYTNVLKPLLKQDNLPLIDTPTKVLEHIGKTMKSKLKSNWNDFLGDSIRTKNTRNGKSGVRYGVVLAGLTVASLALTGSKAQAPVDTTLKAIAAIAAIHSAVNAVLDAGEAVDNAASAAANSLTQAGRLSARASATAGAIGLLISEIIAWGALIYTIVAAKLEVGGLAANRLAASGVAGTITAVALLALALTGPIGVAIAAVIAAIDGLIALVCGLAVDDEVRQDKDRAEFYICKGITGLATYAISLVIYATQDIVTIDDPHRMQILSFSPMLKNPETGFLIGSQLDVDLTVQNTLQVSNLPISIGATYPWQYSNDSLKTSTFKYEIIPEEIEDEEKELHREIERSGDNWVEVDGTSDKDRFAITKDVTDNGDIKLGFEHGLNRPVDAVLAEGFAIPTQECILIYFVPMPTPVPACWVRTRQDTNYTNLSIKYDVFPNTITAFMALEDPDGDGQYVQQWGQDGALTLPPLLDADGDGLNYTVDGEDSLWDSDGDLISDKIELDRGLNPNQSDSDSDNLADWEELLRGTEPLLPDTDGDGLQDGEEVAGWDIPYQITPGLLFTRVASDPLAADSDGDLVVDSEEKLLGTSPYVVSDRNRLALETALTEPYAPDLLLTMDEPSGAASFVNQADPAGETTIVCKNDLPLGYNLQIFSISASDRLQFNFTQPGTFEFGNMNISVNGNSNETPINLVSSNGEVVLDSPISIPVPFDSETVTDESPLEFVVTHDSSNSDRNFRHEDFSTVGSANSLSFIDFVYPYFTTTGQEAEVDFSIVYRLILVEDQCPASGHVGRFGNAAHYQETDAGGDAMTVINDADTVDFSGNFVVGAWIKPSVVDPFKRQVILTSRDTSDKSELTAAFEFGLDGDRLYAGGTRIGDTFTMTDEFPGHIKPDEWVYVIAIVSDDIVELGQIPASTADYFADGTQAAVTSLDSGGVPAVLTIGAAPNHLLGMTRPFSGLIDELVVTSLPAGGDMNKVALNQYPYGIYNRNDGIVTPGQQVQIDIETDNKLLAREIRGFHTVEYPVDVFDLSGSTAGEASDLFLRANQSLLRSQEVEIKSGAPAGRHTVTQTVEAAVAIPVYNLFTATDADKVFEWKDNVNFDGTSAVDFAPQVVNQPSGDFTFAGWIKPPAATSERRGIWGKASQTAGGSPSLDIQNNELIFGFGSGGVWQEVRSGTTLNANAWNFVAVSYQSGSATFYINDGAAINRPIAGTPFWSGEDFFIGRSRDTALLTLETVHLTCEYDFGGAGEYDFVIGSENFYSFEGTDNDIETPNEQKVFSGDLTVTMCEDDDNIRSSCSSSDRVMGSFTVSTNKIGTSTANQVFSSETDSACTWRPFVGWPDTALVSYQVNNPSVPFVGGVQNVALYDSAKDSDDVEALREGETFAADFRFDELPGSVVFSDANSFHEATCEETAGRSCPTAGVAAKDQLGVEFDGDKDALNVDSLARSVADSDTLAFGAWIKPESASNGAGNTVLAFEFNETSGNRLSIFDAGNGRFKVKYFDRSTFETNTTNSSFELNEWTHVAVAITAGGSNQGRIYVNGQRMLVNDTTIDVFDAANNAGISTNFAIGHSAGSFGFAESVFDGVIDRVFVVKDDWGGANDGQLRLEMAKAPSYQNTLDIGTNNNSLPDGLSHLRDAGVRGDALHFNGNGISTFIPEPNENDFPDSFSGGWTISTWVKLDDPEGTTTNREQGVWLIAKGDQVGSRYLRLKLVDGKPRFEMATSSGGGQVEATEKIVPNVWQHLVVRQVGNTVTIFLNGSAVASETGVNFGGSLSESEAAQLQLGRTIEIGAPGLNTPFSGSLDEIKIYLTGMEDKDVRDLYNQQRAWTEDEESIDFWVATQSPEARVAVEDQSYFSNSAVGILLETSGDRTGTINAELEVVGNGQTVIVSGQPVIDAVPGSAYLAMFDASSGGEGEYALRTRATNIVGLRSEFSEPARTIRIDGRPPVVTIDPLGQRPIKLDRAAEDQNSFVLNLSGTVSDPNLGSTALPGSGVATVEVIVYDSLSLQPIASIQSATISGSTWSIDYLVKADNLTGEFLIDVLAQDAVGNRTPSAVVRQQRGVDESQSVLIDTTSPVLTVESITTESANRLRAVHSELPGWLGLDSVLKGQVDDTPVNFVTNGVSAGINTVEIEFAQIQNGGPALRHNALPAKTALYLPFDESELTENGAGRTYTDPLTGATATCSGQACPASGSAGHTGQAVLFDGNDDILTVQNGPDLSNLSNGLTVAAWVRPGPSTDYKPILTHTDGSKGFDVGIASNQSLNLTAYDVESYEIPYAFTSGQWAHVAVSVNSAGKPTFYVNGSQIGSPATKGVLVGSSGSPTWIGSDSWSFHDGDIDELVVVQSGLSSAEILNLMNDRPSIRLTFDTPIAQGSEQFTDHNLMGSIGQFTTTADHNGAISGVVGSHGLQILSGSGDQLRIEPEPATLPAAAGDFTLSTWGYSFATSQADGSQISFTAGTNTPLNIVLGGERIKLETAAGSNTGEFASGYWNLLTVVQQAGDLTAFVNGQQVAAIPEAVVDLSQVALVDFVNFAGGIDDFKLYKRALTTLEINEQVQLGWQLAVTSSSGTSVESANWQAAPPAGLEGFYDVNVRAVDTVGNFVAEGSSAPIFTGLVDTLSPRGSFDRSTAGGSTIYTVELTDFSLDRSTLQLPDACSSNTVVTVTNNRSAWFMGLAQQAPNDALTDRAVSIKAVCSVAQPLAEGEFTVCDTARNCAGYDFEGTVIENLVPPAILNKVYLPVIAR